MDLHHVLTSQPYQSFYNILFPRQICHGFFIISMQVSCAVTSSNCNSAGAWVSSSQSDHSLSEVTFFCGGSLVTSSQVGAGSSVIIFLHGASAVASAHVGPSSPRGRAGQHHQLPHSALSHSSPESEGSTYRYTLNQLRGVQFC